MTTESRASLVEGLVARLRQGQLVRASEPMNIGEHGIAWSGEVRQLAHPDATAAADMIEQLASEVSRLEALRTQGDGEGFRERVLSEARRNLRLTEGCLECNANDERRWRDTITWLEKLA